MIEPIKKEYVGYEYTPDKCKGNKFMLICSAWQEYNEKYIHLGLANKRAYSATAVFKQNNFCYINYYVSNLITSKEDFFNFLKKSFPDHFIWLLFNQFWLQEPYLIKSI